MQLITYLLFNKLTKKNNEVLFMSAFAVSYLRRLDFGVSQRKLEFRHTWLSAIFVLDEVTLE
jgi:hypothetical protein